MLLMIALGFGGQVLNSWHGAGTPPAATPAVPSDLLGDAAAPHVLEFGDQAWSIRRQEFSGREGEVNAALQAACRAAILDSRPRGESADADEQELLKRLAGERPVAEEPGQWRLYRWGEGHPVLIGTKSGERGAGSGEQEARAKSHLPAPRSLLPAPRSPGTKLDETTYRVVIWGMAIPVTQHASKEPVAWTLYLFQSGGAAGGRGQSSVEVPLPPGGHRLVSIRAVDGGAITAFSVDHEYMVPNGRAAREFYDRWFADHGWTVVLGWQQVASGWQARFETRPAPALAVDIRLGMDPQGDWSGLVMESQGP
jgi:hypothetical protein